VIRAWDSLGYNIRARRFHELALEVIRNHGGALPDNLEDLRRLPGLGPYAAAAVANFAFDAPVPVIDTNIERVLNRIGFGPLPAGKRQIEALASVWMPRRHTAAWHQGLMDVGAVLCKVAKPVCDLCPFRAYCKAAPFIFGETPEVRPQDARPRRGKQSAFKGSNRFYRGRIVKILRSIPQNTSIEYEKLAEEIFHHFNPGNGLHWFQRLLAGLEKDGLIRLEDKGVTLP
jgi:A/G-specific adenine glycosylase